MYVCYHAPSVGDQEQGRKIKKARNLKELEVLLGAQPSLYSHDLSLNNFSFTRYRVVMHYLKSLLRKVLDLGDFEVVRRGRVRQGQRAGGQEDKMEETVDVEEKVKLTIGFDEDNDQVPTFH